MKLSSIFCKVILVLGLLGAVEGGASAHFSAVLDNEDVNGLGTYIGIPGILAAIFFLASLKYENHMNKHGSTFKYCWYAGIFVMAASGPLLGMGLYHHNRHYETERWAVGLPSIPIAASLEGLTLANISSTTGALEWDGIKIYGMRVGYGGITEYYYDVNLYTFLAFIVWSLTSLWIIFLLREDKTAFKRFKMSRSGENEEYKRPYVFVFILLLMAIGLAILLILGAICNGYQNRRPDDLCEDGSGSFPSLADDITDGLLGDPSTAGTRYFCYGLLHDKGETITSTYSVWLLATQILMLVVVVFVTGMIVKYGCDNTKDAKKQVETQKRVKDEEAPLITIGAAPSGVASFSGPSYRKM